MSPQPGQLVLVRHGPTEWALAGRHTGLTDVPLLPEAEAGAVRVGAALRHRTWTRVLASPLQRACRTAELAALLPGPVEVDPRLVEWDYGRYEGMTRAEIRTVAGPGWTVFGRGERDGVAPGATSGESIEQVAERTAAVLRDLAGDLSRGDVALVGHGHCLRILTTVYLRREPHLAASLLLDPASVSVLGARHDVPAVVTWNVIPGALEL